MSQFKTFKTQHYGVIKIHANHAEFEVHDSTVEVTNDQIGRQHFRHPTIGLEFVRHGDDLYAKFWEPVPMKGPTV